MAAGLIIVVLVAIFAQRKITSLRRAINAQGDRLDALSAEVQRLRVERHL